MGLSCNILKHNASESLSYYLKAIDVMNIVFNGHVWKNSFYLDGNFLYTQDVT